MKTLVTVAYECWIQLARLFHPKRRNARFVALLGGPGAGKGTVATILAPRLHVTHLNMGKIVRREIEQQTDIGRRWGPTIKAGKLLPDNVVFRLLKRELAKPEYFNGAVLDGFPRTMNQVKQLRRLLASLGNRIDVVVELQVDMPDLLERLSLRRTCSNGDCARSYHLKFAPPKSEGVCDVCGCALVQRDDERPEALVTRMAEYNRTFAPLREYCDHLGLLVQVQSTNQMSPEQVFENVRFAIEEVD